MLDGFYIGPIKIYFYGIILMLGALAGAWLVSKQTQKRKMDPELVWDGMLWVLIAGIIGARLWHVLTPPPSMVAQGITTAYYFTHPLDLLNTRLGGLGIPGAVIGGVAGLYLYCRRNKLVFSVWLDMGAPAVALGQAIGRWGNFVNQELYGVPTNLPWAIFIEPARRLPEYAQFSRFHPLFLYESLYNLANMAFLLWFGRRYADRLKNGDVFLLYLVVYPVGRFFLEFLRLDSAQFGTLNANQTFMVITALVAAVAFYLRHRQDNVPA
jgi:phosphatidylglycerol:prolipoprotein diacylglycerol transferase